MHASAYALGKARVRVIREPEEERGSAGVACPDLAGAVRIGDAAAISRGDPCARSFISESKNA